MTSTTSTLPWAVATKQCWTQIETATKMAKVIEAMSDIPIEAVIPIISTIAPSILIQAAHPDEPEHLKELCIRIKSALQSHDNWASFPNADFYHLRFKHDGISIDVQTQIPVSKPQAFNVGV